MTSPHEDPVAAPIVEVVTNMLDAVLHDDAAAVARRLAPRSIKRVGLSLFGLSAIGIPMGFAAKPHQLGLSAVELADDVAVVEIRGRDADEREVSVCSVILAGHGADWKVEDIWPVPSDCDFTVDTVLEPTVQFYNGQLQLEVVEAENLDAVETILIQGMQQAGYGLHRLEQAVQLWRTFSGGMQAADASGWAAGVHLAVEAFDEENPDPRRIAELYDVSPEMVANCFMEIATRLGLDLEDEQPAAPPQSGLVDLSGRPLGSSGPGGGIILPGR